MNMKMKMMIIIIIIDMINKIYSNNNTKKTKNKFKNAEPK